MKKNKTAKKNAQKVTVTKAQMTRVIAAMERGEQTIVLAKHVCEDCGRAIKAEFEKCYACRFYGKKSFALKRRNAK